jgi:hypothetical protein
MELYIVTLLVTCWLNGEVFIWHRWCYYLLLMEQEVSSSGCVVEQI